MLSLVSAAKLKVEMPESFSSGNEVSFKVLIYDSENNLVQDNVDITIEDVEKIRIVEKTVPSNQVINEDLGEEAKSGLWIITASYQDAELKEFFTIKPNQEIKFEIQGDKLIVTNIGNTRYVDDIYIVLGDSTGTKEVSKEINLNIGEEISFRLLAPDGTYTITVTDGETTITEGDVTLTGQVIGILDERLTTGSSPVTGGIRPKEEDSGIYGTIRDKSYVYVFILVVIGAAILLAIERRFRKRA